MTRRRLPPDPECANGERAEWAAAAVAAFETVTRGDIQNTLGDLLCDLHHFADRHPEYGSFEAAYRVAMMHYSAETGRSK